MSENTIIINGITVDRNDLTDCLHEAAGNTAAKAIIQNCCGQILVVYGWPQRDDYQVVYEIPEGGITPRDVTGHLITDFALLQIGAA